MVWRENRQTAATLFTKGCMMFRWFVSYAHKSGFGCCEVDLPSRNLCSGMASTLADEIKNKFSFEWVVVLNMQRIDG